MLITKFNRSLKKKPQRVKVWCGSCDASLVGPDEKCKVCGHRGKQRRFKKAIEIEL